MKAISTQRKPGTPQRTRAAYCKAAVRAQTVRGIS